MSAAGLEQASLASAKQRKVTVSATREGGGTYQALGTQKQSPALFATETKAGFLAHPTGRLGSPWREHLGLHTEPTYSGIPYCMPPPLGMGSQEAEE